MRVGGEGVKDGGRGRVRGWRGREGRLDEKGERDEGVEREGEGRKGIFQNKMNIHRLNVIEHYMLHTQYILLSHLIMYYIINTTTL